MSAAPPEHLPACAHRSSWKPGAHGGFFQIDLGYHCAPGCPVEAARREAFTSATANAAAAMRIMSERWQATAQGFIAWGRLLEDERDRERLLLLATLRKVEAKRRLQEG